MTSRLGHLALATMLISLAGCAMCANPFDCYYAAYGGRLPRHDMVNGRVGSILDPAGGGVQTTQEIQTDNEAFAPEANGNLYDESDPSERPLTDGEMESVPPFDEESLDESLDDLDSDFDSESVPDADELDRAFEAIQEELSNTPLELDE